MTRGRIAAAALSLAVATNAAPLPLLPDNFQTVIQANFDDQDRPGCLDIAF
jgi:hypothetical protein